MAAIVMATAKRTLITQVPVNFYHDIVFTLDYHFMNWYPWKFGTLEYPMFVLVPKVFGFFIIT